MPTSIATPRRAALALAALAAGLALVLLISPAARAVASNVWRQVGGYAFTLGASRPGPNPSEPIHVVKTLDSVSLQVSDGISAIPDEAAASRQAGMSVVRPGYLPAGYRPMDGGGWYVVGENNGLEVTSAYRDATNHFLIINQLKTGQADALQSYNREQIIDVTVRGQPGVWLPGPAVDGKNALVWAEGGLTYSLISDSLGQAEMLKVAESLRP